MKNKFLMNLMILTLISSCSTYKLSHIEICVYKKESINLKCKDNRKEGHERYYDRELTQSDIVTNYRDYLKRKRETANILYQLRKK